MEQISELVGNPISLLIERIFWLGIGVFLGLALLISVIRSLKDNKVNEKVITSKDLDTLANKAIKGNGEDE